MKFYVYIYCDPINGEPFYIGKGTGNRIFAHLYEAKIVKKGSRGVNWHKINKIRKIQRKCCCNPEIFIYKNDLLEKDAFLLEKKLIRKIGRNDIGKGPLLNLSDGGEGQSGFVFSIETRRKLSIIIKNNPMCGAKGKLAPWWGRKHSEETKLKMSRASKGKKKPKEHCQNMSLAKKDKPGRIQTKEEKRKRALLKTGTKLSEETKLKISKTLTGRTLSKDHAIKVRTAFLGHKHTDETKKKLSEMKEGKKNPMFGKHLIFSDEHNRNISKALKGKPKSDEHKKKLSISRINYFKRLKAERNEVSIIE